MSEDVWEEENHIRYQWLCVHTSGRRGAAVVRRYPPRPEGWGRKVLRSLRSYWNQLWWCWNTRKQLHINRWLHGMILSHPGRNSNPPVTCPWVPRGTWAGIRIVTRSRTWAATAQCPGLQVIILVLVSSVTGVRNPNQVGSAPVPVLPQFQTAVTVAYCGWYYQTITAGWKCSPPPALVQLDSILHSIWALRTSITRQCQMIGLDWICLATTHVLQDILAVLHR